VPVCIFKNFCEILSICTFLTVAPEILMIVVVAIAVIKVSSCWIADVFGEQEACGIEEVEDGEYVLELFRGPTASFKDLSCRLLPHFLQHAASTTDANSRYYCVLGYIVLHHWLIQAWSDWVAASPPLDQK